MSTPRLPPLPELEWKSDGTPVATAMDDVYFSVDDGLAETRAVFLQACGLPERWAGREHFTVAELGFGTGLNLLALWQMWQSDRPNPLARLDFISFEGFPLEREQAERALSRWPELGALSGKLLAKWPLRARGVQAIELGDGVRLILHIDDVIHALPSSQFQADAWFLDGFSPARNEGMWAPEIYPLLMERSQPGAVIGTYTVAGAVRRGLDSAGFEVSKKPGFGRKRERLHAICPADSVPSAVVDCFAAGPRAGKVAVIGGGIAGVCAARSFAGRGAEVTLFDRADALGQGASGNRFALLMPRLDAADTGQARVLIAAYLHALEAYRDLPGVTPVSVSQRPRDEAERARFAKLLADPPLPSDMLAGLDDGELSHIGCLILEPSKLLPALLGEAVSLRFGETPEIDLQARTVAGDVYDAIVLANGMGLARYDEACWLSLEPRLGQVELGQSDDVLTSAVAAGHYAVALGKQRLWGATFEPTDHDEPEVTSAARARNEAALARLVPKGWVSAEDPSSRAGIRATTQDKLPIAGQLPNFAATLQSHSDLRHGRKVASSVPVHDGIWLLGGLGARGFTFAPLLAEAIASAAFGEALPLGRAEAGLVAPSRFILRGLKRGSL